METAASLCPQCSAPRMLGPECPRCGIIYAKAEAHRRAHLHEINDVPQFAPPVAAWDAGLAEAALELQLRAFALPCALLVALLLVVSSWGHSFVRLLATMWLHESGHALVALLCGYPAFPLPWFTPVAGARAPLLAVLLALGLAFGAARAYRAGRNLLCAAACALLCAQLAGTLLLRADSARALILFGGDAGALVLGTLFMLTLYARPGGALHRGFLRWGLLGLGAAAFMDVFEQWWAARTDSERIPFGMFEGGGLSDPSVLTETFGWTERQLVFRYVALGCTCLAVLALCYVVGLVRARSRRAAS
jgi:hypothetical protein